MKIFLYGPPGSGKSAVGKQLAEDLKLPFVDLDLEIEKQAGCTIEDIFSQAGEAQFRSLEQEELNRTICHPGDAIISLGAGALLDEGSQVKAVNAGPVICLTAPLQTLLQRLEMDPLKRPLLNGRLAEKLALLLETRADHYASFQIQMETKHLSPQEAAWQSQVRAGYFWVDGMGPGYRVFVSTESVAGIGKRLKNSKLSGPFMLVTDENVADWWGHQVMRQLDEAGLEVHQVTLPAGESFKNIQTLSYLWEAFAEAHLDRKSTVVALGGGVVTDLAGFAAATYLRGIPWVAMPTSLLGMVDASIGGKTGIDLQKGKNLAGAFFAPRAVLVYPEFLSTLPDIEIRNGLAEVVKAALIGDPGLFTTCARGWEAISQQEKTGIEWHQLISRAIAVKIGIIQKDPYEKELRRALNLGHTLGHAIEAATDYRLRHGEAVAIGMVAEARLGEQLGYTEPGLSSSIADLLSNLGLPIQFPREMKIHEFQEAIRVDKKHLSSEVRLPLPVGIGQAPKQIDVMEEILWTPFWS